MNKFESTSPNRKRLEIRRQGQADLLGPLLNSTFALFALLLVYSPALGRDNDPCHLRELELCTVGALSLLQSRNGLPVSEAEMERQCEFLQETSGCVTDYATKCLTPTQGSLVSLFSSDYMELEKDICNNSTDLRQDYMKKATCLREIQRKHQRGCMSDLQKGFESIHKTNISLRLDTACCNINRLKECFLPPVEKECGQDALRIVEHVVVSLFGSFMDVVCRNHDPTDQRCTSLLPASGAKPQNGRNTSALSRVISSYVNVQP